MRPLIRLRLPLLFLLLSLTPIPPSSATEPALPKNPAWDLDLRARAGVGTRDNVVFSPFAPEAAPFLDSALEASLFRLSTSDHQLFGFATYEDRRYLGPSSVDHEQVGIANAQWIHDASPTWQTRASLQYLFFNQIYDASVSEGDFGVIQVKGHSLGATPALRYRFPSSTAYFEAAASATRQIFAAPLDDFWETGPRATLGWTYGHRSEVTLGWELLNRTYDSRSQTLVDGTPLPGQTLAFLRHRFEAGLRHYWNPARTWRSSLRISFEPNRDNSGGYYDYDRLYLNAQLRWTPPQWEFTLQARASSYAYPQQTANGDPQTLKERHLLITTARAERALGKNWRLYAEFEREIADSNEPTEEYRVHTWRCGFDYAF